MELSQGLDRHHLKIPKHLDHRNPKSFEIQDLKKLILQTTKDLEETDRKRRQEFKEYEMEKERLRLEKLRAMDEEHRKKAEQEYLEQQKKHKDHPKLHHPGSKQQLEEVWEKQDHLPAEEFNPKLFFKMHDLDGDNHWSQEEVNALFQNELNKMYDMNAPEDDIRERYEEMERMREHVFNETDTNHDNLISFEEFMYQSNKQDFEQDSGWQTLDEGQLYAQDEYEQYERRRQEELARKAAAGINPYGAQIGHPVPMQPGHIPPHVNPGPVYQHIPQQGQMHYPQQQINPQQYNAVQGQHPQGNYHQGVPPTAYKHEQQFVAADIKQFEQQQQQHQQQSQQQQQQQRQGQQQQQQPSIQQQSSEQHKQQLQQQQQQQRRQQQSSEQHKTNEKEKHPNDLLNENKDIIGGNLKNN